MVAAAVLLAGCASRPIVTVEREPAHHAWWLRTVFDPAGRRFRGIPARDIRAGWCAIDELVPAHFRAYERADGATDPGVRYAVPGPIVDRGETELVLAVFRECAGPTGTAMVLLPRAHGGQARVLTVDVIASPARYATLDTGSPDHFLVARCRECDDIDRYRWDPPSRRFVALPESDEGGQGR